MSNIKSVKNQGDVSIVSVQGNLDAGTAPSFNQALKELIGQGKAKLVLDLAQVIYVASAGLGVFVAIKQMAMKQKGDVRLANVPENIMKIFELLGYSKVFVFGSSVEEVSKTF